MFKEILKIIPRLENKDLHHMENQLNRRFSRVAKKFGRGLKSVLSMGLKGGLIGMGLGVLTKVLNPLKETQEALTRALEKSDELVTNAAQFNTTTGNLVKLNALAEATGLQSADLFKLISRYQLAVANNQADPENPQYQAVKNFTKYQDTGEGFYRFIQSLQKMDKSAQVRVQEDIFGERQILKMADFLQQDFHKLSTALGLLNGSAYSKSADKLAALSDYNDILKARRNLEDLQNKGGIVNKGMISEFDRAEKEKQRLENMRLKAFESLQAIQTTSDKLVNLMEQLLIKVGDALAVLIKFGEKSEAIKKVLGNSRAVRGVKGKDEP